MVKFTQATCPNCGGQLQIPDNLTKAFCSYCGATVLVEWEGRPGPGPTGASYMKLGQAAMRALNYEEAYEYFSKALELNPDQREAWLWRGAAGGGCWELEYREAGGVSVPTGRLRKNKFQEAQECLRQSGLTHDEMVVLLVDGLRTDSFESNRSIVGSTVFFYIGIADQPALRGHSPRLLDLVSQAPVDLALLYLEVAERIEPSAIGPYAYSVCIEKAIRAHRLDLVQKLKQKIAETAPTTSEPPERSPARSNLLGGACSLGWSSTSAKDLHEAASLLELALQIASDTAYYVDVAGSQLSEGKPVGYVLLALRAVEHGLPELAEQFLKRALELGDKSGIAQALCVASNYITRTESAAGLLDLALRIDPHNKHTANAIAGTHYVSSEQGTYLPERGGYLQLAERAAADGLLDLAERYLERALEIARDKKAAKEYVNVIKERHGLRRPKTGWFR